MSQPLYNSYPVEGSYKQQYDPIEVLRDDGLVFFIDSSENIISTVKKQPKREVKRVVVTIEYEYLEDEDDNDH